MLQAGSKTPSVTLLPDGARDAYAWLRSLPPGLVLDVGASNGLTTLAMLKASPDSRAFAFEPFPGNHPYIDKLLGNDPRVRVIKKAVSDHSGEMKFFVPSVVKSGTGSWSGMEGFSFLGLLVDDADKRADSAITVVTCRLDDEVDETVRFLKIDVQGGEFAVLEGARGLFDRHGVEVVLVEFTGDDRVVRFLADRGYALFDTCYHSSCPLGPLDSDDWCIIGETRLSNGRMSVEALPINAPGDPAKFCAWFAAEKQRYMSLWTDLVAIAPWSQLPAAAGSSSTVGRSAIAPATGVAASAVNPPER